MRCLFFFLPNDFNVSSKPYDYTVCHALSGMNTFFSGYRLLEKLPCDDLSDNIFDRFKPCVPTLLVQTSFQIFRNLAKKEYGDYEERLPKDYCNNLRNEPVKKYGSHNEPSLNVNLIGSVLLIHIKYSKCQLNTSVKI